jgi:hypothetical protein
MNLHKNFFATALFLVAQQALATPFEVDSDLKDWLSTSTINGDATDWNPRTDLTVKWMVEDDTGQNTYLNPGWGGQDYDAEAVYVHRSSSMIHIAVVTGRAPDAGGYVAGDIAIDFGLDGVFDIGVATLDSGTGVSGDLFEVSEWNYGLWVEPAVTGDAANSDFGRLHPTSIKTGAFVDKVAFSYDDFKLNGVGGDIGQYAGDQHYVIETAISLDLIEGINADYLNQSFLVHWTMACANDFVEVDPPADVPVPAPLLLLLAGLIPLARTARHRSAA